MANQAWSIAGTRVELRAGFPAGKLAVLGPGGAVIQEIKLSTTGEWQVPIAGQSYRFVRVKQFMGPRTDVFSPKGEQIPPSAKHVAPGVAPAGSTCPTHPSAAAVASCARCGTFACVDCLGADATHCKTCLATQLAEANATAAAMRWMVPGFLFIPLAGCLGGVFGMLAGAAVVAIVKRTKSTPIRIAAAVGLYGLALVITLALATAIQLAKK